MTTDQDISRAQVTFAKGDNRWTEIHEYAGTILDLQTAVRLEALTLNRRIVGFVPIQYGNAR